MATRSRTRASAANATNAVQTQARTVASVKAKKAASPPKGTLEEKQNVKIEPAKPVAKRGKVKVAAPVDDGHCTCSKGDDGSPMILCAECEIWHHFVCVDVSERDADDITLFICPSCSQKTGFHSTMSWEGLDAFEEGPTGSKPQARAKSRTKTPVQRNTISSDESGNSGGSEDEYVGEVGQHIKDRGTGSRRRRPTYQSSGSEADSDTGYAPRKRTRRFAKQSSSPAPTRQQDIKRKASTSEARPPAKKQKAESTKPEDDPTRKYCLGKLEDLFRDIFFRYPHVRNDGTEGEGSTGPSSQIVSKSLDDMSEAEKEALLEESKAFAAELEKFIFDGYAEFDKAGHPSPGINYKDRFRTLQFNLSKPDRVFIHRRITSSNISAKELSGMSSTDLANEETQQEIKQAEQEALEHSILQKVVAPRAKITHKGLQDIEYHDEPVPIPAPSNDVQLRREAEAEERRERERFARLKPVQRQRTMSLSMPPESPSGGVPPTPTSDTWGAPPPVPAHSLREGQSPSNRQSGLPLSIHTNSVLPRYTPEPEMNLADLINIEEVSPSSEVGQTTLGLTAPISGIEQSIETASFSDSPTSADPEHQPSPSPTTGISPFSSLPSHKQSFNLSTLWTDAKTQNDEEDGHPNISASAPTSPPPLSPPTLKDDAFEEDDAMVESPPEQPDDQDFDMFLEDQATDAEVAPEEPKTPPSVETLPEVWKGKISMPLDSTIPQETPMVARQVAGTPLQPDSLLWKTLFPADHLRIDGRVAVESSAKYLMQMRLSSAKELYAVALSPASEEDEAAFKSLTDFLTAKGRHGLVFPWGSRPKDHHPGRELYMIPLAANEPLPEYVELLDNLRLTKDRTRNYIVGIWILNKGKLAPPLPTPSAPLPVQPTPQNPLHQAIPSMPSSMTPPVIPTYTPPIRGVAPLGPSGLGGGMPYIPIQASAPASTATPPAGTAPAAPAIDPAALAAEVASLTPEQIQGVLRTLQMSGTSLQSVLPGLAQALPTSAAAAPPIPPIPAAYPLPYIPEHHHVSQPQPWQAAPPPPGPYPPAFPPFMASQPLHHEQHPPHDDRYGNQQGDRGSHGWRGRGRGRGRGGGGGGLPTPGRPADSGWPRKAGKNSFDSAERRW